MRADAIVFGIAGTLFGLIIGWVLGSQQSGGRSGPIAAPVTQAAPASQPPASPQPVPVDPERVKALEAVAAKNSKDPQPRVQLGNIYFDAEQFKDAVVWYEQAIAIKPNDADLSTDLGVAYYYLNQPDRALSQFDHSLKVDPSTSRRCSTSASSARSASRTSGRGEGVAAGRGPLSQFA